MHWFYAAAGLLSLIVGVMQWVVGGIDIYRPLMAGDVPLDAKLPLASMWHAQTYLLVLSGAAYFWAVRAEKASSRPLGVILGLFYLGFGGISAMTSMMWYQDVLAAPHWMLYAAIGLFSLLGAL